MIFSTKVAGIPCKCVVDTYTPYIPSCITDHEYGDSDPPEHTSISFSILDRKGNQAPWLEKKLTHLDKERLLEEFQLEIMGERYGYL